MQHYFQFAICLVAMILASTPANHATAGETDAPLRWPSTTVKQALAAIDPDATLKKVASYQYGQDRLALFDLQRLVIFANSIPGSAPEAEFRDKLAAKLAAAVQAEGTADAKVFILNQLSFIATPRQASQIAALLPDPKLSDMARNVLERTPGKEVEAALLKALDQVSAAQRIGVINSLGNRRVQAAVPALSILLKDSDAATVSAAGAALGKIGGIQAAQGLSAALAKSTDELRPALADAALACADGLMAQGNRTAAARLYGQLYGLKDPASIRRAALRGLVTARPERAQALIAEALKSGDEPLQVMAASLTRGLKGEGIAQFVATQFSAAKSTVQVALLGAMADRGDKDALDTVIKALESDEATVRVAALKALGPLGGANEVQTLSTFLISPNEPESAAARYSMERLHGREINGKIVQLLTEEKQITRKVALMRVLPNRNAKDTIGSIKKLVKDENPSVRQEAWIAIRKMGDIQDMPEFMDLMLQTGDAEREEAGNAVAAIARRVPEGQNPTAPVLARLKAASSPKDQGALLYALGAIGDDRSLDALREALKSGQGEVRDAAIRALSNWPTAEPMNELLELARTEKNQVHHVLALGGYLRLCGSATGQTPQQKTALLVKTREIATLPMDKKNLLAQLSDQPCLEAMQMAQDYLKSPDVMEEASLAVLKLAPALKQSNPSEVIKAMGQVIATSKNAEVVKESDELLRETAATVNKVPAPGTQPATQPAPKKAAMNENPKYAWRQTSTTLALLNHEKIVWQFNWPKTSPKPYFHPLALADGTVLTWLSPPDHPWHRALWFAWKELNGINYWEEDPQTGLPWGRTEVTSIKVESRADYSARIEMTLSYHPPDKPAVLTEQRLLKVSTPDQAGAYHIDWSGTFTAGLADVELKGGTAGGGYAGLSVRIAKDTTQWTMINSEGLKDISAEGAKNTHGQHARWADFSLVDKATGQPAGIALLEHPASLRHPAQWHNVMYDQLTFGYFSPAPLWSQPYTLAAGKQFTLGCRVLVHPGLGDKGRIEAEWQAFGKAGIPK